MRDIDVYWSPDSRYVAVTDWIGSNAADCYVVAVTAPNTRFSVADAVPKLPIDVQNAHFYVSCNGWQSPGHLWIMVSGHTDYPPLHDFRYEFTYTVTTHHIPQGGLLRSPPSTARITRSKPKQVATKPPTK